MVGTRLNKFAVAVLEGIPLLRWGFRPRLMPVLAERLGPLRAVGWFLWNMPRYERTCRVFGGLRTHLLTTVISLINGCRYCVMGHATAFELIYLRDRGELFPLDEHAIGELSGAGHDELRSRLTEALEQAGLEDEVPRVDRVIELVADPGEPADHEEVRIVHLIKMFAVLNACGISGQIHPDQVHDPVNKDHDLKQRYAKLRAESVT